MTMLYTPFDVALKNAVILRFNDDTAVEFQFPPRITSDDRKGEWKEANYPGTEPIAVFEKSGPREITLTWTYIVDGGRWTTVRISEQVRQIRGYFARTRDQNKEASRNLVAYFKMWRHGGSEEMSCRFRSVSVKHSETIVSHCTASDVRFFGEVNSIDSASVSNPNSSNGLNASNADNAYPLKTDITVDLRLWTKGGDQIVQDLKELKRIEDPQWY
jgi:hypothetical protein